MNEQARLILSAYRPGGQDANDPAFAEALVQAQADPELRAWLAESQAFDQAIAARLAEVSVPAELRNTILAGAKISRPRRWAFRPWAWAAAAVLALVGTVLALFWPGLRPPLAGWQTGSLAVLEQIEKGEVAFDQTHQPATDLVAWLRDQHAPSPDRLPSPLAEHRAFGCKLIRVAGQPVSLICFDLDDHQSAHLFSTPRQGLASVPPEGRPVFATYHNWHVASWSNGPQVHMLASTMPAEKLQRYLPGSLAAAPAPTKAEGAVLAVLPTLP